MKYDPNLEDGLRLINEKLSDAKAWIVISCATLEEFTNSGDWVLSIATDGDACPQCNAQALARAIHEGIKRYPELGIYLTMALWRQQCEFADDIQEMRRILSQDPDADVTPSNTQGSC